MTEHERVRTVRRRRVIGDDTRQPDEDHVAVEEPLEIRIEGRPVAVTMRTPGADLDLAAGFLFTEGVVDGCDDLTALAHVDDPSDPKGNTVDVVLASGVGHNRRHRADRELFASSSCGVCGKATIDRIYQSIPPQSRSFQVAPGVLHGLSDRLRTQQAVFGQTGGLHAAALFHPTGVLEVVREDIGRHNAVDKVIGWRLRSDAVPIDDRILWLSGRAGFEIVQKAAMAQIPWVVSVGAPSSLAIDLAHRVGLGLIGFLRDGRYNDYSA